jgi:hypothetical protein
MIALSTIWDLAQRMTDLKAFYTDDGILSRSQVMEYGLHNYYWTSAYFAAGYLPFVLVIMCANMAILFCWLVGWHTRFFAALSWWFLVGIQGRQILVGHAGDCLHRILVLLSIFAPCHEYFSVDAVIESKRKARDDGADEGIINKHPRHYNSIGFPALALIFEFLMMYYSAYWHKTGAEWNVNYRATFLAVQLQFFTRPLAILARSHPSICYFLTWAVKKWQWWGNWALISPILFGPLRMFGAIGWQTMHIGFAVCLRLGTFAWCTIAGVFVLYPPMFWDQFVYNVFGTPERRGLRVYYRRNCDKCASVGHTLKIFAMAPQSKLIPSDCCQCSGCKASTGQTARSRAEQLVGSSSGWLVTENTATGRMSAGYDALLDVIELSPLLWIFLPLFLRARWMLSKVFSAVHAHTWGDTDTGNAVCLSALNLERRRKSANPPMWKEFIGLFFRVVKLATLNFCAAFFLYVIVTYNLSNIGLHQYGPNPQVRPAIWATFSDQFWGVFAPRPPDSWWWYNIEAELHNGTTAEIFNYGKLHSHEYTIPHSFDKPDDVGFYQGFRNHRWFKFYENGYNMHARNQDLRLNFGRWLCREYLTHRSGDERLYKFRLWMLGDRLNPNDELGPRLSTGKRVLWDHRCYDKIPGK